MNTVCIVTYEHLSYNPRVLKEADALHEAGFNVRVVAKHEEQAKAQWDARLLADRHWRLDRFDVRRDDLAGRARWFIAAAKQRIHQRSALLKKRRHGLDSAINRYFSQMCRVVTKESADLFVAHNLQALPVAAFAARKWKTRFGFDAEDFHRCEISDSDTDRAHLRSIIVATEEKYIRLCHHMTAASDGIAEAYFNTLGVGRPLTILNVFPLSEREGRTPSEELKKERQGNGISLYWYSQVIGRDRGLDDALNAMALVGGGVVLHVRGRWAKGYEKVFFEKARILGIEKQIYIQEPVPPEQLVERAAQHDVGLALETGASENRRIAVTNKILNYFLAGLAIVASDIPGQRRIMENATGAGMLYRPGDARAVADQLRQWRDFPDKLKATKARSKALGGSYFCWDKEKSKLVQAVTRTLMRPA